MSERPQLPENLYERLCAVLSKDRVIVAAAEVDEFRDPFYIPGDESFLAAAVVEPLNAEEVQEVVRLANEFEVPVWPHSQGRNNGYGGPSPAERGSIQISFRKMNRVIEINEKLAYAVVEPGVRWFDLYQAIEDAGYDLVLSVPDLGWGSPIGNSLDNGVTYHQYGSDFQALNGLEVVLPDGSMLRTGMGAMENNPTWHIYKRGLGPVLDGLFIQSNLGIVVRAGVWLKRKPEAYAALGLVLATDAELEQGVEALRELRLEGVLEGVPSMYTTLTAAPQLLDDAVLPPGLLSEEQIQEIADSTGIGRWAVRSAVWGRRAIVEDRIARIREVWEAIPGARVDVSPIYSKEDYAGLTNSAEMIQAGIPTMQLLDATPPNFGHIGFSPIVPMTGEAVREAFDQMKMRIEEAGVNFLGGLLVINERSCVIVTGIPFDTTNTEQAEGAFRAARRLVEELGEQGYGEYRAHLDFMDLAQDQYGFGDHAYRRFVETVKDAVDPNGVLLPGRHGIWGSAARARRARRAVREGDAPDAA